MTPPSNTPEDKRQPSPDRVEGEARAWMAYLLSGTQDEARDRALEAWLRASPAHRAALEQLQSGWDALSEVEAIEDLLTQPAQRAAMDVRRQPARPGISRRWALVGSLAAAAMIAVTAGVTLRTPYEADTIHLATAPGEIRTFTLSDGSEITLGGRSAVTGELGKASRALTLASGNAHFSIARDERRPLSVTAGEVRVEVLGTRFDIHQRAGKITVAVEEGRVAVSDASAAARLQLAASDQVDFSPGAGFSDVIAFPPARGPTWREGRLSFVNAPLREIVAEINQYSQTPVVLTDAEVGALRLTLSFTTGQIDTMLAGLEAAQTATVTHTTGEIRISSVPALLE
ncbi:MAG: FecR family protein [Hyphomonas sp.]